jgi:hypothetical protein
MGGRRLRYRPVPGRDSMPIDLIRYDLLVQDALRSVVRKVLTDVARSGLPGDHHFNISFKTKAPGVILPPQVRERYPDEMAIILQHEFWDLIVGADAFEVSLNFSRKPQRLTVPFDSITGFNDPSVPFGFKLEPRLVAENPAPPSTISPSAKPPAKAPAGAAAAPAAAKPAAAPAARAGGAAKPAEKPAEKSGEATKVVSIDAFRKK